MQEDKNNKNNKSIEIVSETDDTIVIKSVGWSKKVLNAWRRACLMDVPTLAIDHVNIHTNNSRDPDETITDSLGQLVLDSRSLSLLELHSHHEDKRGCSRCVARYNLNVTCNEEKIRIVTTRDLIPDQKDNVFGLVVPFNESKDLATLKRGETLKLTAYATIGTAQQHVKWRPTTVAFLRYSATISINRSIPLSDDNVLKMVASCPKQVFDIESLPVSLSSSSSSSSSSSASDSKKPTTKLMVRYPQECTMCNWCVVTSRKILPLGDGNDAPDKHRESRLIKIEPQKGITKLEVESTGSIPPDQILTKALDSLEERLAKWITLTKL